MSLLSIYHTYIVSIDLFINFLKRFIVNVSHKTTFLPLPKKKKLVNLCEIVKTKTV